MYLSLDLRQNWNAAQFRNCIMGGESILLRDSEVLEELQGLLFKTGLGKIKRGTKLEWEDSAPSSDGS